MNFKLSCKIPNAVGIALSGGQDSMMALHFLIAGRRKVTAYNINHGTSFGERSQQFCKEQCNKLGVELICHKFEEQTENWSEGDWRDIRYKFLNAQDSKIVTAHHLGDLVETYLFGVIRHGIPRYIPAQNENIIRPFLLLPKEDIMQYISKNKLEYVDDPSNADVDYSRNRIRHEIIPSMKQINPGLEKVIKENWISHFKNSGD